MRDSTENASVQGPPRWRAVLFDLDGTLLDTRPGIRGALAAALIEVSGSDAGTDSADVSLPLDDMVRGAAPAASPALRRQVSIAFRRHYDAMHWSSAHVYPGAEASLADLRAAGLRLFVVTNKRTTAARRLLEHFQLIEHLEAVVGQADSGEPVPKGELVARCLARANLAPASAVVVGDSDQDAEAAARWGMMLIAVTSGAGPLGHRVADEQRVEVASLADATASVLAGLRGESL